MLLNEADTVYVGGVAADRIYFGSTLVWELATTQPEFSPDDIAGLEVWLDASQLPLADGAYVDTWPSLVGSLVGANFNAAPYRPVMRANGLNSLPVVRFSPAGGLRWPSTGLDLQWTVIYVGRMVAGVGRVVSAGYPPSNIAFGYHGGLEDRFYIEGWFSVGQTQTANWKLYTGVGEGAPGNAWVAIYNNGVLLQAQAVTGGWKSTFHLNGYNPTGSEETCECEIAEVLIYNRALLDAERIQAEGYLRAKWGLSPSSKKDGPVMRPVPPPLEMAE